MCGTTVKALLQKPLTLSSTGIIQALLKFCTIEAIILPIYGWQMAEELIYLWNNCSNLRGYCKCIFLGWRGLADYSSWVHKELDAAEDWTCMSALSCISVAVTHECEWSLSPEVTDTAHDNTASVSSVQWVQLHEQLGNNPFWAFSSSLFPLAIQGCHIKILSFFSLVLKAICRAVISFSPQRILYCFWEEAGRRLESDLHAPLALLYMWPVLVVIIISGT